MKKKLARRHLSLSRFYLSDKGSAAIESAFVLPIILLLFLSLQDFTLLVSFNRKITATTSMIADTISQYPNTITRAAVTDIFNSVALIMQPTPATSVRVNVYGYYLKNGVATLRWQVNNGNGPTCKAPDTSNFANLMVTGNDLVVSVSCMTYAPVITSFMGSSILGGTSFLLNQSIALRPRGSLTLNCVTVSGGNTSCSS
ncbi:MAG: TadE/TadG family type IV pilus assembly protein [Aestuariivirga sp.]